MDNRAVIESTKNWLVSFIIKYNICPFARQVYESDRIRYQIVEYAEPENCLQELITECCYLDENLTIATTLLILTKAGANFEDFLDLLAIAEQLLIDQGFEGVYQLASFHPDYCFAGSTEEDPANYTNRSPYPMLHIIRESDIEQALEFYQDPELIPERNIELTRKLGLQVLRSLFTATL
jgi:hypothetical protein